MLSALPAAAQQVTLSLGSIEHEAFTARGIEVLLDVLNPGRADVSIATLVTGKARFEHLKLQCTQFHLDESHVSCRQGTLRRGDRQPLTFDVDYGFAKRRLQLAMRGGDVVAWAALVEGLERWHPAGRFELTLDADARAARFDLKLRDASFHTDDYSAAGEHIAATLAATARKHGRDWQWQATLHWPEGEGFWSPWYRRAGMRLEGNGVLTPEAMTVDLARLTLDGLGSLTAGLTWDRAQAKVSRWGFVTEPLVLSAAVKEWLQPMLDARALPGIAVTGGSTRYAAEWSDGVLQSFYAGIENADLKESTGRLALTGVNASIPWERNGETQAQISVTGGMLDDFPLGGFAIPARLHGFDISVPRLDIPFLDGRIHIDDLRAERPGDAWTGRFSGSIDGVSMPRMSGAIGLPAMAGKFSMHIPNATYADHVLNLEGDTSIEVFGGRVNIRRLQLLEPLSKTSRFVADVEARRLDLGLLTSTFSFGSIVGYLDVDIRNLELQAWKPLAFSAHVASSPGDYRRAISRGALIDISALGGAAGAAAVRAIPAAGLFNTFRYDRIGMGCVLKDGVCQMEGLYPEGDGYVLVEGSGIPAVKVMGYNRRIDWDLLVSRLKAVIAGKSKAVIE